jgi:hypothetical protein
MPDLLIKLDGYSGFIFGHTFFWLAKGLEGHLIRLERRLTRSLPIIKFGSCSSCRIVWIDSWRELNFERRRWLISYLATYATCASGVGNELIATGFKSNYQAIENSWAIG